MSATDSHRWTPDRQIRFLAALSRTRSVSKAADFAGMSRESAYRLRNRPEGALFAAAWDGAMQGHISINFQRCPRRRIFAGNLPEIEAAASFAKSAPVAIS